MKELIRKILKESEDDFDWIVDSLNNKDINWVPKGEDSDYQLFYFFPYITKKEYEQYVVPILQLSGVKLGDVSDNKIDHLEIHQNSIHDFSIKGKTSASGDVNYFSVSGTMEHVKRQFINELQEDGALPHDGREIFEIPFDEGHPQLHPQSTRFR